MRRGILAIEGATITAAEKVRCLRKPIAVTPNISTIRRRLVGKKVKQVGRIGKRVVIQMENDDRLLFEPRMTGLVLVADPPSQEHVRFRLEFSHGEKEVLYWDRRGLGMIYLLNDQQYQDRFSLENLGPDALDVFGTLGLTQESTDGQRRSAFANWVASPDNPLTARVIVNRLWQFHFGTGIVDTPSDLGRAGTLPTHPELLDFLASELIEHDWSLKHIHRLIMESATYQQSSQPREEAVAVDASARYLWRFPPRRLEAEVIRDGILQASGKLSPTVGGRSYRIHNVKKRYSQWQVVDNSGPETWRRMIYQERMRRVDDQIFTAFDFPDCGQVRPRRPISTTPLQALNLMNSKFVIEQSKFIASRVLTDSNGKAKSAVAKCFQLILGRQPTAREAIACEQVAESDSLDIVCRALINSNEFAFLP